MLTVETVLDTLKKFDIDEDTLREWETSLGLVIPVDEYGRKQYSPHHVNLFKNIRKHLALGRTLDEIRRIISLPPETASRPALIQAKAPKANAYATVPRRPAMGEERSAEVMQIVERLLSEKDMLHKKLVETEKLNSHLYNANSIFHRKVKELSGTVDTLKDQIQENRNFKLLDDKAKLHAQLIESEKNCSLKEQELAALKREVSELRQAQEKELHSLQENLQKAVGDIEQSRDAQVAALEGRIAYLEEQLEEATRRFDPTRFKGDWEEEAELLEIAYDNFGINIEPRRHRAFRISETPEHAYGNTAVITTHYEYETNTLWQRTETFVAVWTGAAGQDGDPNQGQLQGELIAEYVIDGVPVAKAIYRATCRRIIPA